MNSLPRALTFLLFATFPFATQARAAEALVAVAANFVAIAETLAGDFEKGTGHRLVLTSGSTGKLYAQIVNGAPYDLFLAADRLRPERLADAGLTAAGPITYARGRLGIWIPAHTGAADPIEKLSGLRRIALANPALAPYGAAAMEVIERVHPPGIPNDRLAFGENVAQAYAMVASGAADAGVVAWSTLVDAGKDGQSWQVPADWHGPIEQDAVLLRRSADNPAAQAFFAYLTSAAARALIDDGGYLPP